MCPGGFGTFDELFELLTLMQSGKVELAEHLPIVLLGERFWRRVVDWQALLDFGTIAQADLDRLFFTDSVDEAFAHATERLLAYERARAALLLEAARAPALVDAEAAAHAHAHAHGPAARAHAHAAHAHAHTHTHAHAAPAAVLSPTSSEEP